MVQKEPVRFEVTKTTLTVTNRLSTAAMLALTSNNIKQALAGPRPGLRGQQIMAPDFRPLDPSSYEIGSKTCRRAAVLLLVYPIDGHLYTVLTERRHDLAAHPGQISMPGGSRDGDETVAQTAIREAHEEIGVDPDAVEALGRLTHIYIPPSHFCIQIVVGYTAERPHWRANPDEIETLIEVPLSLLFDPDFRHIITVERDGKSWPVRYFAINDHKVWGATAMALGEFVTMLEDAFPDKTRPPFSHPPIYECAVRDEAAREGQPDRQPS